MKTMKSMKTMMRKAEHALGFFVAVTMAVCCTGAVRLMFFEPELLSEITHVMGI